VADVSSRVQDGDAPRLRPGTYDLTKRVEVDENGVARFIDMPEGWTPSTSRGSGTRPRSWVRKVDGASAMVHVRLPSDWRDTVFRYIEQYEDARNIAEWLDACGADLVGEAVIDRD
jgi:hypothetical protein